MKGTIQEQKEAYDLCLKLAKRGNHKAQFIISSMVNEGKGTYRDQNRAIIWLRSAADGGNTKAIISLVDRLFYLENGRQEAYERCKNLAETGHCSAQYRMGLFYRDGVVIEKNINEAKRWFLSSAEKGDKRAQNAMITLLMNGSPDEQTTAYLECSKVAEAGNEEAQYTLSNMYLEGIGTASNKEKSMYWLRESAHNGSNEAKIVLIDLLSKGDDKDSKEAYTMCLSLASTGHLGAQYRLGVMYWNGNGTEKNTEETVKWITASADGGYKKARVF